MDRITVARVSFASVMILSLPCSVPAAPPSPSPGKNRVLLISGGHDKKNNEIRYLENIRTMYETFRKVGYSADDIQVLYGGGSLSDTFTEADAKEWQTRPKRQARTPIPMAKAPSYQEPKVFQNLEAMTKKPESAPEIKHTAPKEPQELDPRLAPEYVFSDPKRKVNGPATKEQLKKVLNKLVQEADDGDVTLFLTDHGALTDDYTMTTVNLWGEELRADEFKEILDGLPGKSKIRIITNICFGGGLTALTSDRVCVFASQQRNLKNISSAMNLNLYAQNFSAAMALGLDKDKDGKASFMDAHEYATLLDDGRNLPYTSLDHFLLMWKQPKPAPGAAAHRRDPAIPKSKMALNCDQCQTTPDAIQSMDKLISDFDRLQELVHPDFNGIAQNRRKFLKGRIKREVEGLKDSDLRTKLTALSMQQSALKVERLTLEGLWKRMSKMQRKAELAKANLKAAQLSAQEGLLKKEIMKLEGLQREIDFLRTADDKALREYENIRNCMEGSYAQTR